MLYIMGFPKSDQLVWVSGSAGVLMRIAQCIYCAQKKVLLAVL
jgi:hypothetical protein